MSNAALTPDRIPQHAADAYQTRPRIPLPAATNEREFADKVLACLAPWFRIDEQVTGKHPFGRRVRIDAILTPRDPAGWHDQQPAFGVEFKNTPDGTRDYMTHAAQAVDYTFVDWTGYGRLGVFMCAPGRGVFPPRGGWADPNFVISHLLGQFTVGELCYLGGWSSPTHPQRKWALLIHGHHVLWSQGRGLEEARRRTIKPKVGAR